VQSPLVGKVKLEASRLAPERYDVTAEEVIVLSPVVPLYMVITSPAEKTPLGIVILPPPPIVTNSPTSLIARV
jgi:hypothetical protein